MSRRRSVFALLGVTAFYLALTAAVTYPQVRLIARAIPNQVDAYFNIWRLAWIAHQLPRDPAHLFDANIFYPEPKTLAYSDAILAPGFAAAPLFWAHANPVLIYNLVLLLGIACSGLTTFVLVRHLTGNLGAALVAGAFFVCAPYRFDHYVHLELQLTLFMPLTLWALHRTVDERRWTWAGVVGLGLALQVMCSIYYGVFFATILGPIAAVAIVADGWRRWKRPAMLLAGSAVLASVLLLPYMTPYLTARRSVGVRDSSEVHYYSAMPQDYLAARSDNPLYGGRLNDGSEERHLFPGFAVLAWAAIALWPPIRRTAFVYVVAGAIAFEASLGLHGVLFRWLRIVLLPYQGLRVPARFGMLVAMALAVLAGYGVSRVAASTGRTGRVALVAVTIVAMLLEAGRAPALTVQPTRAAPIDAWLRDQPKSVLVELPVPPAGQPFQESEGQPVYHSIFHWQPILNGTSGFFPASYLELLDRMVSFPDASSLRYLKGREVRFIVMRQTMVGPGPFVRLREALGRRPEISSVWRFPDPAGDVLVFELAP